MFAHRLLFVAAAVSLVVGIAGATQYPPGPAGSCPDTLTIQQLKNPNATCHPNNNDTVLGIQGVVTGIAFTDSVAGFWMQDPAGGPYSGIFVNTGLANYGSTQLPFPAGGLAVGDRVAVYGAYRNPNGSGHVVVGAATLDGADGCANSSNLIVRRIASGQSLPPIQDGAPENWNFYFNPNGYTGDQFEGCLVHVGGYPGPLTWTGMFNGNQQMSEYQVFNPNLQGIVRVDTRRLVDFIPGYHLSFVQGILRKEYRPDANPNGYYFAIVPRNEQDIGVMPAECAPNLVDAYPVANNQVSVLFDRPVTQASAQNVANYSAASFADVVSALQTTPTSVTLTLSGSPFAESETITAANLLAPGCSTPMYVESSTSFFMGAPTADVFRTQAALRCISPSCDPWGFLGWGILGSRVTISGVCTASFGASYYLESGTGALASGIQVRGPNTPLLVGHSYRVTGHLSVSRDPGNSSSWSRELQLWGPTVVADLGAVTPPAPATPSIPVLKNTTCDCVGAASTANDYAGMIVRLSWVKVVQSAAAGQSFRVAGPYPAFTDTITIAGAPQVSGLYCVANPSTFAAVIGQIRTITGVLAWIGGSFYVVPRGNGDILDVTPTAVTNLRADFGKTTAGVAWWAPANVDGSATTSFELRRSSQPINDGNYASAQVVATGASLPPGTDQCVGLTQLPSCSPNYFAVKTVNALGQWSPISNVPYGTTRCGRITTEVACENDGGDGQIKTRIPVGDLPLRMALAAPRPNPSRDQMHVEYAVPGSAAGQALDVAVFDVLGRRVRTLANGVASPGTFSASWALRNETDAPVHQGVYFVRFNLGTERQVRVVTVVK